MKTRQGRALSLALLITASSGTLHAQQAPSAAASPETSAQNTTTEQTPSVAPPPAVPDKPKQLTPFKPTEKIRADDAVAFPVDI